MSNKIKGNRNFSIPLMFLVAGVGFEHATFGLRGKRRRRGWC